MSRNYTYRRRRSPNQTPGRNVPRVFGVPRSVEAIVIHWWDDPAVGPTFAGVRSWFESKASQVSAHYVAEAGLVERFVGHSAAAWHAGNSRANATTLGIELNPRASDGDYRTAADLIRDIRDFEGKHLPLRPHSAYSNTQCPGVWDLERLERMASGSGSGGSGSGGSGSGGSGYSGDSIVDYLESIGQDSSYSARSRLAAQHGITGYRGTAAQNTRLLETLRG